MPSFIGKEEISSRFLLIEKDVSCRFFEFDVSTKSKVIRKKETLLSKAQWQIEIDENLLPDERMLLERDFSIEIPREPTPPTSTQSPVRSWHSVDDD